MINLEEEYAYNTAMKRINKSKNKLEDDSISALGVIGNSIMNGADLFTAKMDDIGSFITGVTLLPYEWFSGDKGAVTEYLEENEQLKTELQKNIKNRREEIDTYAENNVMLGVPLKVASGFIEQTVDPLQMGLNIYTTGFFMNALQNTLDYAYEEHLLDDRKITDFGLNDFVNIGTGVAMAGITSKFQVDDIAKPLYDEFTPSLDKLAKLNKDNGNRTIDREALSDIVKRQDSGQTLSLPKGYSNSETISKTIDDGFVPRLRTLIDNFVDDDIKANYKDGLYQSAKKSTDGDLKIHSEISRIIKPLYSEIFLGRKQALGEIADELGGWAIKNNKYDGVSNVGDYIDLVFKDIKKDELVRLFQGKNSDPAYENLQPILQKYINEFVEIKSSKDLSFKNNGFYLDTLYNKQHLMAGIRSFSEANAELDFIKGQMKDIGSNVFIDIDQATKLGLDGEGFYNINENPKELLRALLYDINSTTKSVRTSNIKGDIGLTENTLLDVALKWVDMDNKDKYLELLNKLDITENESRFIKNFKYKMLEKFENLFKGYEQDKRGLLENIISTIADERSGYNKAMDKLGNFSTPYTYNDKITDNIQWLDFAIPHKLKKTLLDELDELRSLSAYGAVKGKNYSDLSTSDKVVKGMRDFASYKLLWGFKHITEASPNTAIVNTGAYRLGFDDRISFTKGNYEMYKTHQNLLKNYDKLIKRDLASITNPVERMEVELFVRKLAENGYNFNKWDLGKTLDRLALIGGAGQSVSDVHRIGMSMRFTTKAMFEEFPTMKYNDMTSEMKSVLKNNGIDEKMLSDIQNQIRSFKNNDEFFDFVMNSDLKTGGKIKSLFEQFTDIMGKEFEPYDKNLTKINSTKPISKLWLNSQMLFKRYSMGAFSRAWETATSYYDSNDMLRYRFIKNGTLNSKNTFQGDMWRGFKHHSLNLSKMSASLWVSTQAVRWLHGKASGTSADEMVEAKYEALVNGDYLPVITEGVVDSLTDYIGYDVIFGKGGSPFFSIITNTVGALKRAFTSDELEPEQKILYSLAHIISPMHISRGIDNIKFGKNITTNLNSASADANYLWKHYYRKEALSEQAEGELPIEKAIKKGFETVSNWTEYFNKNPEKAYEVTNFPENTDKEIVKMGASGIMELTERAMRDDHIMYSFSIEDVTEREGSLKEFGLDYKSQLMRLDPKIRDLFNYVMAFKNINDPRYLITALEEMVNSKNKINTLHSFLREDEIPYFNNFAKNIIKQEQKKKELARRGYQDNTEGYIEFLQALRNEI